MDSRKSWNRMMWVAMIAVIMLGVMMGCSIQSPMSVSDNMAIPPPPLTEDNIAAGPAPGYGYLPVDVTQIYSGMNTDRPMYTRQLLRAGIGGSVYFPSPLSLPGNPMFMTWWHGVMIPPTALAQDVMITMLVPDPNFAVVDFGPHPYSFESDIQVELSYSCANLNQIGVEPEQLVIMYWDETVGQYEEIPTFLNRTDLKLYGRTNHFSRYIIATGGQ